MRQCPQLPSGQTDWPQLLRSSRVHNQNLPQFLPYGGANVDSRVPQAGKDCVFFLWSEGGGSLAGRRGDCPRKYRVPPPRCAERRKIVDGERRALATTTSTRGNLP